MNGKIDLKLKKTRFKIYIRVFSVVVSSGIFSFPSPTLRVTEDSLYTLCTISDARFVCLQRGSASKLTRRDRRSTGDDASSGSDVDPMTVVAKIKEEPREKPCCQEPREYGGDSDEEQSKSEKSVKKKRLASEHRQSARSLSPVKKGGRYNDRSIKREKSTDRSSGELSDSPHKSRKRRFKEEPEPDEPYSSSKYQRRHNSPLRDQRSPLRGVRRRHVFSPEDLRTPKNQLRQRNWSFVSSPTVSPCDRSTPGWYESHSQYRALCHVRCDVVLVGDSIVKGLARYPRVWRKYFSHLNALNFGIGGDRTQHVLWRLQNGELECKPKVIVVHCGTNNIDKNSSGDIVQGLLAIVDYIRAKQPQTMIVVVGLLPRDLNPTYRRSKIDKVNSGLEERISFSDELKEENVYFLKPDDDWVDEDGKLNENLYYTDHLHLVEDGDEKLGKAISEFVEKLLEEKGEKISRTDNKPRRIEFGGSDLQSLIQVHILLHR